MRKPIVVGTLIFFALLFMNGNNPVPQNPASEIMRKWIREELKNAKDQLSLSLAKLNDVALLRKYYHEARKHYKHVEFFVEYYSPREAKFFINGPLVPKIELEVSSEPFPPQGFQRIEELLFSDVPADTTALRKEYDLLLEQLSKLSDYYQHISITDGQLLEMCQWELFRIAAMNLSGYDATLTLTNVLESAWCLEGIEQVIRSCKSYTGLSESTQKRYEQLLTEIIKAIKYLRNHPDYNTFNRLDFITDCVNPLNRKLVGFHHASGLPWSKRKYPINLNQDFLFGEASFNVQYFSLYYNDTLNLPQQARLGKLLFFDPVLSGNNMRSCASCHQPSKGFTDGVSKNKDFGGASHLERNTPTLMNVIYQKAFFYDGRAFELEKQIMDVVHSKSEMQSGLDDIVVKLRQSSEYRRLFKDAFHGSSDTVITPYAIQKAITEYEKTLLSMNSRFDRYLRGEKSMLTKREINGYNVFAGKALCGSCHFFPLFNGTVPPFYKETEYEIIGTPKDTTHKALDSDVGRYSFTRFNVQRFAFKTPTVRNAELTAPYMHNGIYATLEEVIEFYNKGGGAGFNIEVPNQTLPFDSLKLTQKEKENMILFLKSLTDTTGLTSRPNRLPIFENDPSLNKRVIGGEY